MKFRSMSSIVEPPRLQTDSSREYLEIERSDLKFGEPVEKDGRMLKALWISQNKKTAVKMLSNLNDREVSMCVGAQVPIVSRASPLRAEVG